LLINQAKIPATGRRESHHPGEERAAAAHIIGNPPLEVTGNHQRRPGALLVPAYQFPDLRRAPGMATPHNDTPGLHGFKGIELILRMDVHDQQAAKLLLYGA
jgi:hypothetical protein